MKRIILFNIFLLGFCLLYAQETTLKKVTNTFKDRITLQGYAQGGYTYDDMDGKSNTFELKRLNISARGKITDHWSCYFMYNFANSGKLQELYTEYSFFPELSVRFGQFKTMYTIENPLSPSTVELINVFSQAANYLTGNDGSDPLYGNNSGRDIGLLLYGNLFKNFVSYNLAVMNGQGINQKDQNNQKDIVGGLMFHPANWVSVGGSFVKGKGCAVATSEVNPDIAVGDDYTRNRWAVGATIQTSPIDLRTEYLRGKDGTIRSEGYYATLSAHVLPKFDIIASFDFFNKDRATSLYKQTNYVAGVQYWFFTKCRLQLQYTYCNRSVGENYNLLQAQVQVGF